MDAAGPEAQGTGRRARARARRVEQGHDREREAERVLGSLAGQRIASSDEPFVFTIGQGQCAGWDVAARSMRDSPDGPRTSRAVAMFMQAQGLPPPSRASLAALGEGGYDDGCLQMSPDASRCILMPPDSFRRLASR